MTSMDGVAKHRTERGSAGSISVFWRVVVVDPALPRSVLCLLTTVHAGHQLNNTQLPHYPDFELFVLLCG